MAESAKMKRADQRSAITILVLGDEAVGKSSLISTFVSRYFSEIVPGLMTRVRLPPSPDNSCVTTIVDSQGADAALIAAVSAMSMSSPSSDSLAALLEHAEPTTSRSQSQNMAGIENIDSIVLVYDLDRAETFFRLENHWLPLIERCYNGKVPVIVAENKMDLFRPTSSTGMTDEQALARKRQQIVSLMQRFPFVRQCIKCSAKNLLRVDDVFLKAQQAVIYPFTPPLYDLEHGRLTAECKRAFTRIFRLYDEDRDGLLSDAELDRFQKETYHVAIFDRDIAAWKKVVTRYNPSSEAVLEDGKFTISGFLAIFDVFISQNRLDVVWQALRKFGYDDELNLHMPDSVSQEPEDWKLSKEAMSFLTGVFTQFDSDKDGILTVDDVVNIFSIVPPPALPPWHPIRASDLFGSCLSRPKHPPMDSVDSPKYSDSLIVPPSMAESISNSGISIFSDTDSLPSMGSSSMYPVSKPLSYLDWMGWWHAMSAISPRVAREELFRLGFVERAQPTDRRQRIRKKKLVMPSDAPLDALLPSKQVRILVLGSHASGKTALLNALCRTYDGSSFKPTDTSSTNRPETSSAFIKIKSKVGITKGDGADSEIVIHLVFTDVPETAAASQEEYYRDLSELFGSTTSPKDRVCDLAMLVFDCTKNSSFLYAKELESNLLTKETPRVFVATKSDLQRIPEAEDGDALPSTVLDAAQVHCRESELEPPLLTSAKELGLLGETRQNALDHLSRCALSDNEVDRLRSRPYEEQQRREAARKRKMMWLGGIVSVGVVVAVGVGMLWGSPSKKEKSGLNWIRSWFNSSLREPLKTA